MEKINQEHLLSYLESLIKSYEKLDDSSKSEYSQALARGGKGAIETVKEAIEKGIF
jgi:hypothetical protein